LPKQGGQHTATVAGRQEQTPPNTEETTSLHSQLIRPTTCASTNSSRKKCGRFKTPLQN